MSWTREPPSSSPLFTPLARALILAVSAALSLVAGLIGLLAALIGLMVWQLLRPTRPVEPEPETQFRFVR